MTRPKPKPITNGTAVLDELATQLPPATQRVHPYVPRLLWQDFREIASLHHRDANKEIVVAIQEHVRRYRADLNAARREAHHQALPDDDETA